MTKNIKQTVFGIGAAFGVALTGLAFCAHGATTATAAPENASITWNADFSEATVNGMWSDTDAWDDELVKSEHAQTVKSITFSEGSGLTDAFNRYYGKLLGGMPQLETADLRNADLHNLTFFSSAFSNDYALKTVLFGTSAESTPIAPADGSTFTLYGMFHNCNSLEYVDFGSFSLNADNIDEDFVFYTEDNGSGDVRTKHYLPNLKTVIMGDTCLWSEASTFNYSVAWSAYQNDQYVATLNGYDEWATYQATHPGSTTYKMAEAPAPDPTPGMHDGWYWDENTQAYYYLFDNATMMAIGWWWIADDYGQAWYYFNEQTGAMVTNTWVWDTEYVSWYFQTYNGQMAKSDWLWIDNEWYGFWWNGKMCQGWVWDDVYSAWYYCSLSGAMMRNAWIGPYYVNEDGVWTPLVAVDGLFAWHMDF